MQVIRPLQQELVTAAEWERAREGFRGLDKDGCGVVDSNRVHKALSKVSLGDVLAGAISKPGWGEEVSEAQWHR